VQLDEDMAGLCTACGSGASMARPPFFYCGEPAVAGRPYCATHMDAAHSHWVRA